MESLGAVRDGSLAEKIAASSSGFETVPRAGDDLAAILYTSGTTGRAKGAMLTHENLSSNAMTLVDCWRFTAADRLIHALPVFHTHGLFVAVNVALVSRATMIFQNRFEPNAILHAMPNATSLMGVPTFYTRLLVQPGLTREVCRHMRLFVSGSAPLLAETHAAWRERTGFSILERYGMTETSMIASNPYQGERRPGTVGFALPGVSVRISEAETGAPVPAGEIGVIEVKGPNVFCGYWRMPEKTAQEFRPDGFFITGDLGRVDHDGYIHIVGRAKDLVISGGFNVYPKEVESEIDAIEGVLESAVIGVPHADFGEAVTAVVVPRPGAVLTEAEVLLHSAGASPSSKRRSACLWSTHCRATPWGKCRRPRCGRSTATLSVNQPRWRPRVVANRLSRAGPKREPGSCRPCQCLTTDSLATVSRPCRSG